MKCLRPREPLGRTLELVDSAALDRPPTDTCGSHRRMPISVLRSRRRNADRGIVCPGWRRAVRHIANRITGHCPSRRSPLPSARTEVHLGLLEQRLRRHSDGIVEVRDPTSSLSVTGIAKGTHHFSGRSSASPSARATQPSVRSSSMRPFIASAHGRSDAAFQDRQRESTLRGARAGECRGRSCHSLVVAGVRERSAISGSERGTACSTLLESGRGRTTR